MRDFNRCASKRYFTCPRGLRFPRWGLLRGKIGQTAEDEIEVLPAESFLIYCLHPWDRISQAKLQLNRWLIQRLIDEK